MFTICRSTLLRAALVSAALGAALALPPASPAAVTVGEDMTLDRGKLAGDSCFGPGVANTFASTAVPPGRLVASPLDGVVVRWSAWVDGQPASVKFRVLRPVGGGQFTGVGASAPTPSYVGVGTFDSRIPIKAGDHIGVDLPCTGASYMQVHYFVGAHTAIWAPTLADGAGPLASNFEDPNYSVMVSADVEPDADGDGYGDETQDQCPVDATTRATCPAPAPAAAPPAVADKAAPAASASFKRSFKLGKALRRGIRGSATSNEAGNVRARATLGRRAARRLGFKRAVTVAGGTASLASPGKVALKLEFGRKAKRKLAAATRVNLKLQLSVADGAGNTVGIVRSITLIR